MRVENAGLEVVLSCYLYGLIGLSALVVISPAIVFAVPILLILGPVGVRWWRGRRHSPRVGGFGRWWLVAGSVLILAAPVVPAIWFLVNNESGAPKESFWLFVAGSAILPFPTAAVTYLIRCRSMSGRLPLGSMR